MARDQRARSKSRRSFCRALAGVLIAPDVAIAQTSKAVRRIGVLEPGSPNFWTPKELSAQAEPLRQLGWVEGQNLQVERRYAKLRSEALQPLAEELVRAQVEIIVTAGTRAMLGAKNMPTPPTTRKLFDETEAGDAVGCVGTSASGNLAMHHIQRLTRRRRHTRPRSNAARTGRTTYANHAPPKRCAQTA